MTNILPYIIQVTLVFATLYALYSLFLRRLTFHTINRAVLLLMLPVSILIPFSSELFPAEAFRIIEVPYFEPISFEIVGNPEPNLEQSLSSSTVSFSTFLLTIYWSICALFLLRIVMTMMNTYRLKQSATAQKLDGHQIILADVSEIFSYFKWIFIPKHKFEHLDQQILEHEKIHIQLKHSWDVLLTEVYIAFFWFNPLVYFYRKSLKSVHEYQADKGVLKKGVKTSEYMQLLLESLAVQRPNISYHYFNQPTLKKRVTMMTKPKSKNITKLTYLLLLPLCVLLISAFKGPTIQENTYLDIKVVSQVVSSPPSVFPVQNTTKKDITAFFGKKGKHPKLNKNIRHTGIDIRANLGTPVIATADGVIAKANNEGDWGNLIIIAHTDGYETWYAHLQGFNIEGNQEVKKGEIIGYVGNTGRSTGPHLHYEVKHNGKQVNPLDYLE